MKTPTTTASITANALLLIPAPKNTATEPADQSQHLPNRCTILSDDPYTTNPPAGVTLRIAQMLVVNILMGGRSPTEVLNQLGKGFSHPSR